MGGGTDHMYTRVKNSLPEVKKDFADAWDIIYL